MKFKEFKNQQDGQKNDISSILVKTYMTKNLITFSPKQSVMEVMQTLIDKRISGAPVVNKKNELLGIISEGDCMKEISESRYYNIPLAGALVEKYMVTNVETISANISIFDVATKFYKTNRKRFPVIENGKLIGQISRRDILKAALEVEANNW
ncbi:MAG: CBS domain-containing protein [Flavobacteriaceae bacterium]|nr:CBS domain-containing protein [Flavobacteriaceae bacterium]